MSLNRRLALSTTLLMMVLLPAAADGVRGQAPQSRLVFQGGTGGNNFQIIWEWLTQRLRQDPAWRGTIAVVQSDGIAGLDALRAGKADFTLVKAPATVGLAYRGVGLFAESYQNLRAFGVLPVPDWLTFVVRPGLQARTVSELLRQDRPLRIATGRDSARDVVTFIFQEILRSSGSSFEDLERRKSAIVRLDPGASLQAAIDGKVDAVFQEASSMPQWDKLFETGWTPVSIDAAALDHLERQFGFGRTTIPSGWHRSNQVIQTVEFSNVLLCARAEVPDDQVAWVTRTFLQRKAELEAKFLQRPGQRSWLAAPIDPAFFAAATVIPHHPGATKAFGEAAHRPN